MNSASLSASLMPSSASSHRRRASARSAPVASSGFHAPLAWSAARSSTASTRWAIRPKSRPASLRAAWLAGFPASTAVCANAAAVAVSVGSVTVSREVPGPAAASTAVWRPIASVSTPTSKPSSPAGPGARRRPPGRERGRRAADPGPAERAVAVVGVVADLRRRQDQRHRGGQPGAVADRHVELPHPAQRAPPGRAPLGRAVGLGLGEHRDHQPVVVGRQPRRLPVVVAQRQAHAAQVRLPRGPELPAEPVPARPNDPEHCPRPPTARPAPRCRTRARDDHGRGLRRLLKDLHRH